MHDFTSGPWGLRLRSFYFDPFMGPEENTTGTSMSLIPTLVQQVQEGLGRVWICFQSA